MLNLLETTSSPGPFYSDQKHSQKGKHLIDNLFSLTLYYKESQTQSSMPTNAKHPCSKS